MLNKKVMIVSLGCDKNLVDTEKMLGILADEGCTFTDDEAQAQVIIVNTCCFIGDAKEESIQNILDLARFKTEGKLEALIATGCLSQRYQDEMLEELPELDGILGIMFAYTIYSAYKDDSKIFKSLKILSGEIMLCLTKTSGLGLAVLSLIIILVKILIDRKKDKTEFKSNIKSLIVVCIITAVITSMWYIKVNNSEKRWDFSKYVETQENQKSSSEILKNFVTAVFMRQDITTKKLTVFSVTVLLIGLQIYSIKKIKNKSFNYYAIAMLISIPIYLISLAITYMTIFEKMEGSMLTCFDRYTSTILLATLCFNAFALFDIKTKFSIEFIVIASIIIALMPLDNIHIQYVRGKNYIRTSNTNRDIYTKIENYKDKLTADDKILYMAGDKANMEYLRAMNEYVMMPIRIKNMVSGNYESAEKFEKVIERYDYVFVYRTNQDTIDNIKACFEDEEIERDTLYKVVKNNKTVRLVP